MKRTFEILFALIIVLGLAAACTGPEDDHEESADMVDGLDANYSDVEPEPNANEYDLEENIHLQLCSPGKVRHVPFYVTHGEGDIHLIGVDYSDDDKGMLALRDLVWYDRDEGSLVQIPVCMTEDLGDVFLKVKVRPTHFTSDGTSFCAMKVGTMDEAVVNVTYKGESIDPKSFSAGGYVDPAYTDEFLLEVVWLGE